MNCVNCRIRSKNYKKYVYCVKQKKEICFAECECCKNKMYKEIKPIRKRKHARTKATDISKETKFKVWVRDNHRCIFCGKIVGVEHANAHYIPRSAGGLGIAKNIFTACDICHHEQDNGKNSKVFDEYAKSYLKDIYGADFNIKDLIYVKH